MWKCGPYWNWLHLKNESKSSHLNQAHVDFHGKSVPKFCWKCNIDSKLNVAIELSNPERISMVKSHWWLMHGVFTQWLEKLSKNFSLVRSESSWSHTGWNFSMKKKVFPKIWTSEVELSPELNLYIHSQLIFQQVCQDHSMEKKNSHFNRWCWDS